MYDVSDEKKGCCNHGGVSSKASLYDSYLSEDGVWVIGPLEGWCCHVVCAWGIGRQVVVCFFLSIGNPGCLSWQLSPL